MTIADLQPGTHARVARVDAQGPAGHRLMAMGLLPGTVVELRRVGPTGDPLWLRVRGIQLALRRKEAALVAITEEGG